MQAQLESWGLALDRLENDPFFKKVVDVVETRRLIRSAQLGGLWAYLRALLSW
jgi:hypothetical protein